MSKIASSDIGNILAGTVQRLSEVSEAERPLYAPQGHRLPSVASVKEIMFTLRQAIFPDFFCELRAGGAMRPHHIGVAVDKLFSLLQRQIAASLHFAIWAGASECDIEQMAREKTAEAVQELPELKRVIYTDVQAIFNDDPAARSEAEVIFCYPSVTAMLHYRFAHLLASLEVPLLPRIITEIAHSETGIDIHPGARIGEYFSIDHGTGVVIGETCVIGRHVTIYQGVTLGAKHFTIDEEGHPINVPRHPIIEDNVTIYSNASVLGRITIGHDSVIGGNVWVTNDVPPHSRILQGQPRDRD